MIGWLKMRKYQQKSVNKVSQLYQSNDPLKWVYIASVMGVNRPMTRREARIFIRRFKRGFQEMAKTIAKVFKGVATTVTRAVEGLTAFAKASQGMPSVADIKAPTIPPTAMLGRTPDLIITDDIVGVKHDTAV